jgi:hypothetical protein
MRLTPTLAERIAGRMRRDGFECTAHDVTEVERLGHLTGDRDALASRILQEMEELGIDAGP